MQSSKYDFKGAELYEVGAQQVRSMCGWRSAKRSGRLDFGGALSMAKGKWLVVGTFTCFGHAGTAYVYESGCLADTRWYFSELYSYDFLVSLGNGEWLDTRDGYAGCFRYEVWHIVDDRDLWLAWEIKAADALFSPYFEASVQDKDSYAANPDVDVFAVTLGQLDAMGEYIDMSCYDGAPKVGDVLRVWRYCWFPDGQRCGSRVFCRIADHGSTISAEIASAVREMDFDIERNAKGSCLAGVVKYREVWYVVADDCDDAGADDIDEQYERYCEELDARLCHPDDYDDCDEDDADTSRYEIDLYERCGTYCVHLVGTLSYGTSRAEHARDMARKLSALYHRVDLWWYGPDTDHGLLEFCLIDGELDMPF